jgi:protein-disulfide isomerase
MRTSLRRAAPRRLAGFAGIVLLQMIPTACATTQNELGRWRGATLTESSLDPQSRQALYEESLEHYRKVRQIVGRAVAAKAAGDAPAAPVSDEELQAYYEKNAGRLPYSFEEAKGELRAYVEREKRDEALDAATLKMMKDGELTLALAMPAPPVFDLPVAAFPTRGAAAAKVLMVEFGDLTCPFCRAAAEPLERLTTAHADGMRFVFVPFSVHRDAESDRLAIGALCADEQGKFFAYLHQAFARQGDEAASAPAQVAAAVGVADATKFAACTQSASTKERLESGFALARELGVSATPTLYLNGYRVPYRIGTPAFDRLVARELGLPEGTPLVTANAADAPASGAAR